MNVMRRNLNFPTSHGRSLHTATLLDVNDNTTLHGQSYCQQIPSLAENTLSFYNNNTSNGKYKHYFKNQDTRIETRLHLDTGL